MGFAGRRDQMIAILRRDMIHLVNGCVYDVRSGDCPMGGSPGDRGGSTGVRDGVDGALDRRCLFPRLFSDLPRVRRPGPDHGARLADAGRPAVNPAAPFAGGGPATARARRRPPGGRLVLKGLMHGRGRNRSRQGARRPLANARQRTENLHAPKPAPVPYRHRSQGSENIWLNRRTTGAATGWSSQDRHRAGPPSKPQALLSPAMTSKALQGASESLTSA